MTHFLIGDLYRSIPDSFMRESLNRPITYLLLEVASLTEPPLQASIIIIINKQQIALVAWGKQESKKKIDHERR